LSPSPSLSLLLEEDAESFSLSLLVKDCYKNSNAFTSGSFSTNDRRFYAPYPYLADRVTDSFDLIFD